MPVTPSVDDIILLIVEIPCYLYHVSVAYLIIWHIVHRVSPFTNAFFVLFSLICCADLGYFLFCSVMNIKLAQLGLFTDFFVSPSGGWVSTIGYMSGEYFGIFQALTHMVITVNRFNVFYFSAHYDKIWQGRRLVAVVIFLIISPVGFFAWHLNHRILYYMVDENTIAQMMDDLHVQLIVSTMGFILFVITTGINVVLGAVTAFRYRQLTRQGSLSRKQKSAKALFFSSMSLTFAQLLRTLFHAGIFISASTNNRYLASTLQKRLPLIADVYALTGSVFLLIISTDVRRAYLTFYGFRKGTVAVSVSSSAKAKTSFVTTTEHQQRVSSAQFDKNKE